MQASPALRLALLLCVVTAHALKLGDWTCDGDTCEQLCDTSSSCDNLGSVDCPDGKQCVIKCTGEDSCLGEVTCSSGACDIECTGKNSCSPESASESVSLTGFNKVVCGPIVNGNPTSDRSCAAKTGTFLVDGTNSSSGGTDIECSSRESCGTRNAAASVSLTGVSSLKCDGDTSCRAVPSSLWTVAWASSVDRLIKCTGYKSCQRLDFSQLTAETSVTLNCDGSNVS